MVLTVIIGDLHFKKDSPTITDVVISKITEEIKRIKPDLVVFLGDILDTHDKIDMKTQNTVIRWIKKIAAMDITVVLVVGNHERPDGTSFLTEDSSLFCFKGLPNIYVADRVLDLKWDDKPGSKDKIRFIFVPYVPPGTFHDALDTLEEKVIGGSFVSAIFCHQEFRGVQMAGYTSKGGDEWPETNPLIISGHIHKYQVVRGNILYPGTPHQQSYADDGKKGIVIANFTFGQSPAISFLELDIRKKKIIKLKPGEIDSFVPPPNCDLQVDICGNSNEIKHLNETGIITKMRAKGINVSLSTEKVFNPGNPQNKPFKELLTDMLATDQEAKEVFNSIFAPQQPTMIQATVPVNLADILKNMQSVGAQPRANVGHDIFGPKQTENAPVAPAFAALPMQPTPQQQPLLPGMMLFGTPSTPATLRQPSTASMINSTVPVQEETKMSLGEQSASLLSSAKTEKEVGKFGTLHSLIQGIGLPTVPPK